MKSSVIVPFLATVLAGCGTVIPTDAGTSDTGTSDAAMAETSASDAAVEAGNIAVIHGCTSDQYTDMSTGTANDRMIMLNRAGQFDTPCMTINRTQAVIFMWNFTTYPITPGVGPSHVGDPAGSTTTPIQMRSSGTIYTVTFPDPGLYPFYVPGHDATMAGVISVQ